MDFDRDERPQAQYECIQAGHHFGSRVFDDSPPEKWLGEGKSLPLACHTCRKWKTNQRDEEAQCASCGAVMQITAKYKVAYHRHQGVFEMPKLCKRCTDNPRPKMVATMPPRPGVRNPKNEETKWDKLPINRDAQPLQVISDASYYQRQTAKEPPEQLRKEWRAVLTAEGMSKRDAARLRQDMVADGSWPSETRQEHIEQHLPDSPHQETRNDGWEERKSPTSLVGEGVGFEGLLMQVGHSMLETNPAVTRQYQEGNRVIKLTYSGDDNRIEVTILHPRKEGYEVVTTYDSYTPVKVLKNLNENWR